MKDPRCRIQLKIRLLSYLLSCFFIGLKAQVALKGGEISLQRGTVYQYTAKVGLLLNWPANINIPYVHINWGDNTPLDSLAFSYSDCTADSATAIILTGSHTFPANGTYTVTVIDSFLIAGIVNIPNSGSQKLILHQVLTTTLFDSPAFSNYFACLSGGVACHATDIVFNGGEADVDGDSLGFSIVGNPDIPGYVFPAAVVNGSTGTITFSSNVTPGYYNVRLKIDEWRKTGTNGPYAVIGNSYRDLIFRVLCSPLGIKFNEVSEPVQVYPNPFMNKITVELNPASRGQTRLKIINTLGQTVLSQQVVFEKKEIDLSFLAAGLYYIHLQEGERLKVIKIIKE